MAELRWLLLLIGIGIIAAVYIYTRYKSRITDQVRSLSFRREPNIGQVLTGDESLPLDEPDRDAELAVSAKSSPAEAPEPSKVVAVRLMSNNRKGFEAEQLILILRELGLRHGQFGIFHRLEDSEDENSVAVFSIASLVEPGSFDLTRIKTDRYPGISLFLTLPGPLAGVSAFDEMMDLARVLARRLDGYLLDEQGGTLSIQRERYLREEIIQFEHQELS